MLHLIPQPKKIHFETTNLTKKTIKTQKYVSMLVLVILLMEKGTMLN